MFEILHKMDAYLLGLSCQIREFIFVHDYFINYYTLMLVFLYAWAIAVRPDVFILPPIFALIDVLRFGDVNWIFFYWKRWTQKPTISKDEKQAEDEWLNWLRFQQCLQKNGVVKSLLLNVLKSGRAARPKSPPDPRRQCRSSAVNCSRTSCRLSDVDGVLKT